jgi:uncharacterized secreted protein with C-terminal beta-propeller domain
MRTEEPYLSQVLKNYEKFSYYTKLKIFYISPYLGQVNDALLFEYDRILSRHDFVFIDDYYSRPLSKLFY